MRSERNRGSFGSVPTATRTLGQNIVPPSGPTRPCRPSPQSTPCKFAQLRPNPITHTRLTGGPGSLAQAAADKILVTAIYTSMMKHTGTFHKHKVGEGGA